MRLVEKLRRIAAPAAAGAAGPLSADAAGPCVPGGRVDTGLGRVWIRRLRFPLGHCHGRFELSRVAATGLAPLAGVARDPALESTAAGEALYFDTETTSLGGGAGTYVFLLGAGYFETDAFVVEQYFLSAMHEERALLDAINRRFADFELVVSFYGKGFDLPRLRGRNAFHALAFPAPARHLDLCLVGRSLFRGAFADCRLQTFERELVGFLRDDDLPGAECPEAFFRHMQGDSSRIPRVFEHNAHDVLTLPAVAASFVRAVERPVHPVLLANLGAHHETAGRDGEARSAYEAALGGLRASRHDLLPRILERLALLERRRGRHARSAGLLLERVALEPASFQPLEDLAKYHEHRARDPARAIETALRARTALLTGRIRADAEVRERQLRALDHRLGRLRRKLATP